MRAEERRAGWKATARIGIADKSRKTYICSASDEGEGEHPTRGRDVTTPRSILQLRASCQTLMLTPVPCVNRTSSPLRRRVQAHTAAFTPCPAPDRTPSTRGRAPPDPGSERE